MLTNSQNQTPQIKAYQTLYKTYEEYANLLKNILSKATKQHAPLAIVQTRPKSLSSFAEKIVRKKYTDPLVQMTDLCGARVIASTLSEVDKISRFIRKNFVIDENKSIDKKTILKSSEFGYLSVHFIVFIDSDSILGVDIPEEIKGRKAEVQIRTLLQHAWSDISHDRLYKTTINVPENFKRDIFQIAALLENADKKFNHIAETLDLYAHHYEAFIPAEKLDEEQKNLETILENEPDPKNKPKLALQLSRIYREKLEWEKIIDLLEPFSKQDNKLKIRVLTELGQAYCKSGCRDAGSKEHQKGIEYLTIAGQPEKDCRNIKASNPDHDKERADALALLANALSLHNKDHDRIRDLYCQACRLDNDNPYFLASHLEHEILASGKKEHIRFMEPMLQNAIKRCENHINLGIEMARAYFTIGRLNLVMGNIRESLSAYAKALYLASAETQQALSSKLDEEKRSIQRLNLNKALTGASLYAVKMIDLMILSKTKENGAGKKGAKNKPVVIIAGGINNLSQEQKEDYDELLFEAFEYFSGTLISGGTSTGIPGIIGETVSQIKNAGNRLITLLGYAPEAIPDSTSYDNKSYTDIIKTNGEDFSPLEPLKYWEDILKNGIQPENVRLLGIGGGHISLFEFELALCLGATIGLIDNSGFAVEKISRDEFWSGKKDLYILPLDRMTLRAFFDTGKTTLLTSEQLEEAARQVHENFRKMKQKKFTDPAFIDWEDLRDDIKNSNMDQIRNIERTLQKVDYVIREVANKDEIIMPEFSKEEIEVMAEIEHGRWNAERLLSGWRYHPEKDVENKLSPYLVSWEKLENEIREYDREAVRKWPETLKMAGFEIFKLK